MTRRTHGALALSAFVILIIGGCTAGSSEETPSSSGSADDAPTPPVDSGAGDGHDTVALGRIDVHALARHVFDRLADFARTSDPGVLDDVRFTQTVGLGLGSAIVVEVPREDLDAVHRWQIDVEFHRAYVGPFSALDLLGQQVATDITVGEHPHCASAPVAPPDEHAMNIRVSVQPAAAAIDSCLQWWTVDVFVTPEGEISAITLDLWEP